MATTTSAAPDDLATYVTAAGEGTARLRLASGDLRAALDAFRASEGRARFLADVPEVDLDLTFLAQRWDRLAGWLDGVARAFAAADDGEGEALSLSDTALDGGPGRYAPPAVEVFARDGELILDAGPGDDALVVGDGGDHLLITGAGATLTYAVDPGAAVRVRLGDGDDRMAYIVQPDVAPRADVVLDGGSGNDLLIVSGVAALLRGGSGDDVLRGSRGDDRILGGAGDDDIAAGAGDDRVIAGDGDDVVDGDAGDDWISAGAGEDLVYGEGGADLIDGGDGRDHLDGGEGVDDVRGGAGADVVAGGDGHDTVDGGAGDDVAYAGPGHDLVVGGSGADTLHLEPDDVVGDATDDDTVRRRAVDLSLLDAVTVDVDGPVADRIRSDLVNLASTAAGARLLEALRGHEVTVVRSVSGDLHHAGRVGYDPEGDEAGFGPAAADRAPFSLSASPLVTLHHELVHAYDSLAGGGGVPGVYLGPDADQSGRVRVDVDGDGTIGSSGFPDPDDHWVVVDADGDGTVTAAEVAAATPPGRDVGDLNEDGVVDRGDGWAPNRERDTVGLPVDHDSDPSTPDRPGAGVGGHPSWMNENELRDELGVERRGRY